MFILFSLCPFLSLTGCAGPVINYTYPLPQGAAITPPAYLPETGLFYFMQSIEGDDDMGTLIGLSSSFEVVWSVPGLSVVSPIVPVNGPLPVFGSPSSDFTLTLAVQSGANNSTLLIGVTACSPSLSPSPSPSVTSSPSYGASASASDSVTVSSTTTVTSSAGSGNNSPPGPSAAVIGGASGGAVVGVAAIATAVWYFKCKAKNGGSSGAAYSNIGDGVSGAASEAATETTGISATGKSGRAPLSYQAV